MEKKKKETWTRRRHKVVVTLLYYLLAPYTRWKYGVHVEPFEGRDDRQYLVIMNHQTGFDQFFVAMSFKHCPVYYIATEDIFSLGWISKALSYLVAPIPIKKQMTDLQAVKNCIKVAKEGGTICLAPEGNRTFDGKTAYIKPSIAKLVRMLKLPVAVFRIEGGYGVQPRWSDVVRKGKMRAYVSRVIEPEEYRKLPEEELLALIEKELYVNEAVVDGTYHHKKSAQYLERAMYVCPDCGLSEFESCGDVISCKKCGKKIRYLPTKELKGIDWEFPFTFVADWYAYQCDFVSKLDYTQYLEAPMYQDKANVSEVILYKKKQLLWQDADVILYGDRIVLRNTQEEMVFAFDETSMVTVLGKNKINIYFGNKVFQIKGDERMNALKYVNMYHHYKNIREGNVNGKFLGL